MSAAPGGVAAGMLLIVAGVWLLLQTLVGDLPSRLVGLAGGSSSSAPNPGSPAAQAAGQVGGKPPNFAPLPGQPAGQAQPGTGTAPGAGTGPGGSGYGTGNAPGYQPPGGLWQA